MAAINLIKDTSTAESIKSKTYSGWASGQFHDHPDAASAAHLTVSATGTGRARQLMGFDPKLLTAEQHMTTFRTHVDARGRTMLIFDKAGIESGKIQITSFNSGSIVFFKSLDAGSTMEGWMFQIPVKPAGL